MIFIPLNNLSANNNRRLIDTNTIPYWKNVGKVFTYIFTVSLGQGWLLVPDQMPLPTYVCQGHYFTPKATFVCQFQTGIKHK